MTELHIVRPSCGEPAPTADAYRAACEALEKHRTRADELAAEVGQWRAAYGEDALRSASSILAIAEAARALVAEMPATLRANFGAFGERLVEAVQASKGEPAERTQEVGA